MACRRSLAIAFVVSLLVVASVAAWLPMGTTAAKTMPRFTLPLTTLGLQASQLPATVPDEIAYRRIFHRVVALNKKADELQQRGIDTSSIRQLIGQDSGLTNYEKGILGTIATQCEADVATQDAKARGVIHAFRSQFPNGLVPRGQKLPPPPLELAEMWQQRRQIVLLARDHPRNALSEQSFSKFDQYVKKSMAQDLTVRNQAAAQ